MHGWVIWVIALLAVGIAVIAYGAISDRRKHRKAVEAVLSPPPRTIPQLPADAGSPSYLPAVAAHRPPPEGARADLSDTERKRLNRAIHDSSTTAVEVGFASDGFVTDTSSEWAVLSRPRVLVCAEPIMAIRELISLLEHMLSDGTALVVVATSMAPEVLDTLEVNHIQRKLDLVALVSADPVQVDRIVATTGATMISRVDLQTGYLAEAQLGSCQLWVSDKRRSYIVPDRSGTMAAAE